MKLSKLALLGILSASVASNASAAFIQSSSLFELDGTGSDTIILGGVVPNNPLLTGIASSGTFSITDAAVDALITAGKYQDLVSAFASGTLIGSSDFTNDASDYFGLVVPGAYAFSSGINFNETTIIGQTLYTFMGDGGTLATSGSLGLYRHSNTLAADPVIPPESNYDLKLSGGTLLVGTAGSKVMTITDLAAGPLAYKTITLIPEPSTALLGALGALGLLRRRR
jgi:hypothetical protein